MLYHWLSVFSLATVPLSCLATPLAPHWDDLTVKHTWKAIPENWESLVLPPAGTTVNLHVALKPHCKNALVVAFYKVGSPSHPKHVLSTTPPCMLLMHAAAPLQIWCTPFQGAVC